MRKIGFVVASSLLIIGLMASPSSGQPGAFVFNGTAHLSCLFPWNSSGCLGTFSGTARGATVLPSINCLMGCALSADFNYNEPLGMCVAGVPVAPLGTASGSYQIGSEISGGFSWTRVGLTAVVLLSSPTGAAVAGLVLPRKCPVGKVSFAGVALLG